MGGKCGMRVSCRRFWWYALLTLSGCLLVALPFVAYRTADEGPLLRGIALEGHGARARADSAGRRLMGHHEDGQRPTPSPAYILTHYCLAEREDGPFGSVLWPQTRAGLGTSAPCPYGPRPDFPLYGEAAAIRLCMRTNLGPKWAASNYRLCARKIQSDEDARRDAMDAQQMTDDPAKIDKATFLKASKLIDMSFENALTNRTVAKYVLKALSNLVATPLEVQRESDADGTERRKLYLRMEQYGAAARMDDETTAEDVTEANTAAATEVTHGVFNETTIEDVTEANTAATTEVTHGVFNETTIEAITDAASEVTATETANEAIHRNVTEAAATKAVGKVAVQGGLQQRHEVSLDNMHILARTMSPDDTVGELEFQPNFDCSFPEGKVRLTLPGEVLKKVAHDATFARKLRVRFLAVRVAQMLEPPGEYSGQQCIVSATISTDADEELDDSIEPSPPSGGRPAPGLDGDLDVKDLQTPVRIHMPASTMGASHTCAYYDLERGVWRADGLRTTRDDKRGVVCSSSHLTPFTLLLDAYPRRSLGALGPVLDVVGYVGSSLSVLGLVVTIVTYVCFRFGRDRWGRVLVQLCLSLLLLHVFYLLTNLKGTVAPGVCMAIAILVHVFLLAAFCWMLVEALLLYHLLVTVFQAAQSRFFVKRLVVAWSLPVLVAGVCAAVDPWYYVDTHPDYCVTSASNATQHIVFVMLPCGLVMTANLVIFARVIVVLLRRQKLPGQLLAGRPSVTCAQVRGVIGVAFLLGITWPLSPLATNNAFVQLVASVLNSAQGVAILVSRVLTHPEVRRSWRQRLFPKSVEAPSSAATSDGEKKSSMWSRLRRSITSEPVAVAAPPTRPTTSKSNFWEAMGKRWRSSIDIQSKSTSALSENSIKYPWPMTKKN